MDEPELDPSPLSAAPAALSAFGPGDLRDWRHSLVVLEGLHPGRRIDLDAKPLVMGRRSASDYVLPEMLVSGLHCRIQAEPGRPALRITDLKSTNGTFLNGRRITGIAYLAPGGTLGIGEHLFRHDFLAPEQLIRAAYEDAERLSTVSAWLPDPLTRGPLRTATSYHPAKPAHGAGVAVLPLAGDRHALVLIDVCGQGEQVERHAARVLRDLRDRGDITGPARLLRQLNERWPMQENDGLFFTAWVGVYDAQTHRLSHACAGQHPALLRDPAGEVHRLDALNPPIGLLPGADFVEETVQVAPASRLYAFNRGAFEFTDRQGRQWQLDDFEALLACAPADRDPERVFEDTQRLRAEPELRDDFVLLAARIAA